MTQLTKMTLRVPSDLSEWLDKEAKKIGVSKNALLIQIIMRYKEDRKNKSAA